MGGVDGLSEPAGAELRFPGYVRQAETLSRTGLIWADPTAHASSRGAKLPLKDVLGESLAPCARHSGGPAGSSSPLRPYMHR